MFSALQQLRQEKKSEDRCCIMHALLKRVTECLSSAQPPSREGSSPTSCIMQELCPPNNNTETDNSYPAERCKLILSALWCLEYQFENTKWISREFASACIINDLRWPPDLCFVLEANYVEEKQRFMWSHSSAVMWTVSGYRLSAPLFLSSPPFFWSESLFPQFHFPPLLHWTRCTKLYNTVKQFSKDSLNGYV